MKKDILKIAGVKSEKEFYKKYPTEEAFMKAHGKEFKKAAMGASMVKKQLNQLTDFGNPPQAQVGTYIGGEQSSYKPINYADVSDQTNYLATGMNREMMMQEANLAAQQKIAANSGKKGGIMDMLGQLAPQLDALSPDDVNISTPSASQFAASDADINAQFAADFAGGMRYGGHIPRAQGGGFFKGIADFSNKAGKSIGQGYDKLDKGLGKVGGVTGSIPIVGDLVEGFQQLKQEKEQRRGARQSFELSGLVNKAASLTPDIAQRKYVRPEDQAFSTQEMGQAYGAGTNFLAEYGARIGGNPTEIQNMYNPGDIYSDMGYEPLSDSDIVKQYRRGGLIPKAQFGDAGNALGSLIAGNKGRPTAGGKIGGTIGSTVGKFIPVPGASQALELVGSTVGSIFGGKAAKKTAAFEEGAQKNYQNAAFTQGTRGIQAQNASYMEHGGWVSHNWQPQVITTFGDYKLKDLLAPPNDADMLRAGGHLKNYTAPSAAAMSTERPDFAMGGNLKTTWGGYAEPISQNPYLPGSGETVMFRGQSHDESDGNGNTGIGVKYGKGAHDSYTDYAEYGTDQADADVEVERNEPAVELPDAETGAESMVVYGNMKIPSYGISELGDKKAKGKKFKSYANDLSKIEDKQNKIIDKGIEILDSVDSDSPFDMLKFNAAKAMVEGGNMKLKEIADKKMMLAGIQNAILDTAEEMGVESDALAKGEIKPIKDSNMAKFGKQLKKAQPGITQQFLQTRDRAVPMSTYYRIDPKTDFEKIKEAVEKAQENKKAPAKKASSKKASTKKEEKLDFSKLMKVNPEADKQMSDEFYAKNPDVRTEAVRALDPFHAAEPGLSPFKTPVSPTKEEKDKFGLDDALRQLQPYLIPSNQEPFDYQQITPEMFALASNQLEPVQAQTFQPLLEQPYTVSLQDQMNEIQADVNASKRLVGNNPAALAAIDAQAASAKNKVLGQQLRMNQELQMGAYNRNRGVLNDATLKNLAILDAQYQRQAQAKSATKAQAQEALSSIADKIAKNKLENRTLGIYENMYNFRFTPKGRAISANAPVDFNMSGNPFARTSGGKGQLAPGYDFTYDASGNIIGTRKLPKGDTESSRNGSIVKSIKNL